MGVTPYPYHIVDFNFTAYKQIAGFVSYSQEPYSGLKAFGTIDAFCNHFPRYINMASAAEVDMDKTSVISEESNPITEPPSVPEEVTGTAKMASDIDEASIAEIQANELKTDVVVDEPVDDFIPDKDANITNSSATTSKEIIIDATDSGESE